MSVSQCTPEINLPATINIENITQSVLSDVLTVRFCTLRLIWNMHADITLNTRSVVDDGYDASMIPFIRTGL